MRIKKHWQRVRLVAGCRRGVITRLLVVCSDFLVRRQIIKAVEKSGGSAGTEAAAPMVQVAMADTLGFHGNGDLSDWQEPAAGFTLQLEGRFQFTTFDMFIYIWSVGFQIGL